MTLFKSYREDIIATRCRWVSTAYPKSSNLEGFSRTLIKINHLRKRNNLLKRKQQDYKILHTEKAKTTTKENKKNTTTQDIDRMKNSAGTTTTSFASVDEDEEELRKLTMKQLGRLLKSYGMTQKAVNGMTHRAERVQVIRDFATQAEQEAATIKRQAKEEAEQQHPVLRHQGSNHKKKNKHGATIYWCSVNAW